MKKIIIFILVLVAIAVTGIFVAHKFVKNDDTKPTSQSVVNQIKGNNTTENDVANMNNTNTNNEINNETNENKTEENEINPNIPEETTTKTDEEKAIAIVKKEWGEDSSVNFTFDYKTENGEYVIAVRNSNTTATIEWYIVDLNTGTCKTR